MCESGLHVDSVSRKGMGVNQRDGSAIENRFCCRKSMGIL